MISYSHLMQAAAPFTPNGGRSLPSSTNIPQLSPQTAAAMIFRQNAERMFPNYYLQNPDYASAASLNFLTAYGIVPEEPKPNHSYIGLIAMAILSCPDKKLVLSDIYQYILDNYTYFRTRGPGWRNSIRHNLSLNDCFIKAGRSANGKGHYWAIHPACMDDFAKGDFRRRHAQRKVRKAMGLSVPDEDSDGSTSPSPVKDIPGSPVSTGNPLASPVADCKLSPSCKPSPVTPRLKRSYNEADLVETSDSPFKGNIFDASPVRKKRNFNIDSLLLPDTDEHENDN